MFCKKCGQQISDDSVFCQHCGAPVEKPTQPVNTYSYAQNANYQQNQSFANPSAQPKNKWIALVLCLLGFFLIGGLHRFYAGKIGTGILYLLTGGLLGVGTLIDTLLILVGSFKDSNGVPMN